MSDYYAILGVERNATRDEIKKAYRRKAMELHPDRNPGDHAAEEKFKELSGAYAVLGDPDQRARYDRFGEAGVQGAGGAGVDFGGANFADFEDLIGAFFGGAGRRTRAPQQGPDEEAVLRLSFSEGVFGGEKEFRLPHPDPCAKCRGIGAEGGKLHRCAACGGRGQVYLQRGFFAVSSPCPECRGAGQRPASPCPECRGRGVSGERSTVTLKIPPGRETGERLRLRGRGGAAPGLPPGDLYLALEIEPHPVFVRAGQHLARELLLTPAQAALGEELELETLEGPAEKLKVPHGTQADDILRLKGFGVPDERGRRGDLLCKVRIEVPRKVSGRARALYEELRGLEREGGSLVERLKKKIGG